MKSKLVKCKEILVKYIETLEYDVDAIEYLIDSIEYLLIGIIPCNETILNVIIEDTMVASSVQRSKELLEVVSLLNQVKEQANCISLG